MISTDWKIGVDSRTEPKAFRVFQRFQAVLRREPKNVHIEPYPKTGGHVFSFSLLLQGLTWNDCVVEVIELGQRVGYGWSLSGNVLMDLNGWSNEARVGGIVSIHWSLRKGAEDDENCNTGRNGAGGDAAGEASTGGRP